MTSRSSEEASFSLTLSRTTSASSDSGLSLASQGPPGAGQRRGAGARGRSAQAGKLLAAVNFDIAQPLLDIMTELAASGEEVNGTGNESGLRLTINGEASPGERETDILDDADAEAAPALDEPSSSSVCSLSSDNLPETQTDYSTQAWVRQQQIADVVNDSGLEADVGDKAGEEERPSAPSAPHTPPRGASSREAAQRGRLDEDDTPAVTQHTHNNTHTSPDQDEDLASLATDIDESIEQLNQLILDLDPTFVPVPTRCAPLSRSASLQTNGLSHKGNSHLTGQITAFKAS